MSANDIQNFVGTRQRLRKLKGFEEITSNESNLILGANSDEDISTEEELG